MDYIVAGLGNPGSRYERTRHNAGFIAADKLCDQLGGGRMKKVKCKALYEICTLGSRNILIMKPQTYMNLSGEAVRDMADAFKVPPERIIVMYDDISIGTGTLRIRASGSAGGHNGMKSIIYQLQSDQFPRIRIGVGAPEGEDLADYVLDIMDGDALKGAYAAADAAVTLIEKGAQEAQQRFNNKKG
ncbi:MAG: aminoacyl-tRNA hydrolase [Clostridia bacterium]|nr:aminoacyl-tRNA hydrolase [Clostridia bacterium]MBO7275423.1 aminoacyl-tRNA hydrolase [Clostridia bacterium]